jgi:hypothetical protein
MVVGLADQIGRRSVASDLLGKSMVGRVALELAYANWAHPAIRPIRDQVAELGIEPIQDVDLTRRR